MNVLVLCDRYPYPLEQGLHLRIYNFVKHLPEKCTVDLVCYEPQQSSAGLDGIFRNIKTIKKPDTEGRVNFFTRIIRSFSIDSIAPYSLHVQKDIDQTLKEENYDVVLTYTGMLPYVSATKSMSVIVDVVDDEVLEWWREFRSETTISGMVKCLRYLILYYNYERKYLSPRRINGCFFTSEVDEEMFKKVRTDTYTEVIQNGVDAKYYFPQGNIYAEQTLVFEGNMSFPPNIDGALYFCREILPIIQERLPNVKLTLVGKNPAPEILDLASENITVTGFVDDVRPYVARSCVFVCPLRKGGGIKNKLLQALAMGKACVATSYSVGGLVVNDGENILIRNSPVDFSDAVIDLLNNEKKRTKLENNARITIEHEYSWEKKSKGLYNLLLRFIGE